jgi:ubiquinone/menaquinone biosynthesis C-methylase UbiE
VAYIGQRTVAEVLSVLNIGCGTGNQLIADRSVALDARLVGLDRSVAMLRQAQRKASDIDWVQGDAARLPFRAGGFDFVTCQHMFHHLRHKAAMLDEVLRVLRWQGRLALANDRLIAKRIACWCTSLHAAPPSRVRC